MYRRRRKKSIYKRIISAMVRRGSKRRGRAKRMNRVKIHRGGYSM